MLVFWSTAFAADPPQPAPAPSPVAGPPPNQAIVLSVPYHGQLLVGHVLADAKLFGQHGVTFWTEKAPIKDALVPLVYGVRILGLPQGERIVEEAYPTLMYFESNGDPYVDANDPLFAGLSLFVDRDDDAHIDPGEVHTLSELGVDSISRFGELHMKGH